MCIIVLPVYLYPSAYLSVSMPTDRHHGECPCPNSVLLCQICMVKSLKVMNEMCFRLLGMSSPIGRLSLNCHRVGPFPLMAETDKLQTSQARYLSLHAIPSSSGGPVCAAMRHAKHLFVVIFHLWVPATSLSPSCELWDCRRSWPQPLPTWREMCRTNGSRNYTEIGHTGWISKSRVLVKVSVAR